MYNNVLDKFIHAEPGTGRIARETANAHEIANQSVLKSTECNTIKTRVIITVHGAYRYVKPRVVMSKFTIKTTHITEEIISIKPSM